MSALLFVGLLRTQLAQELDLSTLDAVLGDDGGIDAWDWLRAGLIFVGALVLARVARTMVRRISDRHIDTAVADLLGRLTGYVIVAMGIVYSLDQLGVAVGPLLGALGIAGIAIAFALKDILENFVAGLLLQVRRPFSYGDEIVSEGTEGRVQSIDARSVTVVTPDGETVYLPSSQVITSAIVNHSQHGARRTTVEVGVAYGTDLARASAVLATAVATVDGVLPSPPSEVRFVGFGSSSIDFAVRFWHSPRNADLWRVRNDVGLALDAALRAADITIPFPQVVVWSGPEDD